MAETAFWRTKSLAEMTQAEWESLCDGCGRCCLNKFDDPATGGARFTDVACRLLDPETCRCAAYNDRTLYVPECRVLGPGPLKRADLLPPTCAYRRLTEGRDLAWWHPLISGDPATVHLAGVSVRGRAVSERDAVDLRARVVAWPGEDI